MIDGFFLETNYRSLLLILRWKKRLPTHTGNWLQNWSTILLNYNFKMQYIPSKKLGHEYYLSYLILKSVEPLQATVIASLQPENKVRSIVFYYSRTVCDSAWYNYQICRKELRQWKQHWKLSIIILHIHILSRHMTMSHDHMTRSSATYCSNSTVNPGQYP